MAYFPNGTAGLAYQEHYCANCANADDEGFCPIWDCHIMFSYGAEGEIKSILDLLIPENKDGFAAQCSMFRKVDD